MWFIEALSVALYGLGIFYVAGTADEEGARVWWRVAHVGVILIPVFYYNFAHFFLEEKERVSLYIINSIGLLFLIANTTPLFIDRMRFVFGSFYYDSPPTTLYIIFVFFFLFVLLYAHHKLYRASKSPSLDQVKKKQIRYFIIATFIGLIGGITSFIPVFGINFYPLPNFTVSLYPIIMTYAILRFRLFHVRAVVAEVLVFLIWLFLVVRIFLETDPRERFIDLGFLAFLVILGILLVRSVLEEARQREKLQEITKQLQNLTEHLKEQVGEQTGELKVRNERLEVMSKQKNELITLVAHQLRTPLTAMKWIGQLFSKGELGKLTEEQQEHASKLNEVVEKMIRLVDDILNVIHVEEGKFGFTPEDVDMGELVREIIKVDEVVCRGHKITMTEHIAARLPKVRADRDKIRMAVDNIVDNALKYTPKKGKIDISVFKEGADVVVKVADNGIGISEKDQGRIFSRFFRGRNAFEKEPEGTGLGLHLARNIVKAHNGEITFLSEEGKGTVFTITLPFGTL